MTEGREEITGLNQAMQCITAALECAENDPETAASFLRAAARYITRDRPVTSGNVIAFPVGQVERMGQLENRAHAPLRAASGVQDAGECAQTREVW